MFITGQIYRRRELHETYGGQRQGGISTPKLHPIILFFSGDSGEQYGYKDGWQGDGLYFYTGEGQRGDMRFVAGNRSIESHDEAGKDIHLFQEAHRAHCRYLGQFVCSGFHYRMAPGASDETRRAIVFELLPLEAFTASIAQQDTTELLVGEDHQRTLSELRELAHKDSAETRDAVERKGLARRRSGAIRLYVLERVQGVCEGCNQPAPFHTVSGEPFLEPHHIRRLSDGGPDHPAG